MQKDFFSHLNETVEFSVQILDDDGPVDLGTNNVELALSTELDRPTILTLSLSANNGISVVNANLAIIAVSFVPTANVGFRANTNVYQLRTVEANTAKKSVVLEGRLFLGDSLFD